MANPQRAEVSITLDSVPYTLKFDFNAICEAEEEVGGPVLKKEMGLREIRALVWAGLGAKNGHRRPTVQQVGSMFGNMKAFVEIQGQISQALEAFMGEDVEKDEPKARRSARATIAEEETGEA